AMCISLGAPAQAPGPQLLAQARAAAGGNAWEGVPGLQAQGRVDASALQGRWERRDDLQRGRYRLRTDMGVFRTAEGDDGRGRWRQDPSGGVHRLNADFARQAAVTEAWLTRRGWLRAAA